MMFTNKHVGRRVVVDAPGITNFLGLITKVGSGGGWVYVEPITGAKNIGSGSWHHTHVQLEQDVRPSVVQAVRAQAAMKRYTWHTLNHDGTTGADGCRARGLDDAKETADKAAKQLGYSILGTVQEDISSIMKRQNACCGRVPGEYHKVGCPYRDIVAEEKSRRLMLDYETCPECKGTGEVLMLHWTEPCSQGCPKP